MAEDCLFCSIVAGDLPAEIVYTDESTVAIRDLKPQAPTHVLVIARTHVRDVVELATHADLAARLLAGVRATAETLGLSAFRTVFNTGAAAGQTVFHVHAHILAGRPLRWPPG